MPSIYEQINAQAEENKKTHYQRAQTAMLRHMARRPELIQKPSRLEARLRVDWWRWCDWDQKIDTIPRGHYFVDKRVKPVHVLRRKMEEDSIDRVANGAASITYPIFPGLSISVIYCA